MKCCPKCGASLEPNYEFCMKCGARLSAYGGLASVGAAQTWKPTIAGALTISAGYISLIFGIVFVTRPPLFVVGVPAIIAGVVALAGGLCSVRRRAWGLALAGSICSVPCWLGIPAIILIVLSKREFS
jgi:zinc-ribbon domain